MWASYIQLGTAGPALTCAARDSSPHTNDRYVEHSFVHPMDRECHEIFAALVFFLQSVRRSAIKAIMGLVALIAWGETGLRTAQ